MRISFSSILPLMLIGLLGFVFGLHVGYERGVGVALKKANNFGCVPSVRAVEVVSESDVVGNSSKVDGVIVGMAEEIEGVVKEEGREEDIEAVNIPSLFSVFRAEIEVFGAEKEPVSFAVKQSKALCGLVSTVPTIKRVKVVQIQGGFDDGTGMKFYPVWGEGCK